MYLFVQWLICIDIFHQIMVSFKNSNKKNKNNLRTKSRCLSLKRGWKKEQSSLKSRFTGSLFFLKRVGTFKIVCLRWILFLLFHLVSLSGKGKTCTVITNWRECYPSYRGSGCFRGQLNTAKITCLQKCLFTIVIL